MRVIFCGDRNWTDAGMIDNVLMELQYNIAIEGNGPLIIVEGEARGADSLARDRAEYHGLTVEKYPADWYRYKKAAGPIRNQQMLDTGVDLVVAFHDDLEHSKGTKHMVGIARKAGIPVLEMKHGPNWED